MYRTIDIKRATSGVTGCCYSESDDQMQRCVLNIVELKREWSRFVVRDLRNKILIQQLWISLLLSRICRVTFAMGGLSLLVDRAFLFLVLFFFFSFFIQIEFQQRREKLFSRALITVGRWFNGIIIWDSSEVWRRFLLSLTLSLSLRLVWIMKPRIRKTRSPRANFFVSFPEFYALAVTSV